MAINKEVLWWLICPWDPHYQRWLITAVCVNNSRHESSGPSCVTASLLHPTCRECATPQIHSHTRLSCRPASHWWQRESLLVLCRPADGGLRGLGTALAAERCHLRDDKNNRHSIFRKNKGRKFEIFSSCSYFMRMQYFWWLQLEQGSWSALYWSECLAWQSSTTDLGWKSHK